MQAGRLSNLCIGAAVGTGLLASAHGVAAYSQPRPNVLFIVADDLNNALGCYGAPVKTPHLDRLAREGIRFDNARCQYPLCNPSRASLLSGRRPETTRIYGNDIGPKQFLPAVRFLPEHFLDNGYHTARYGKIAHNPYENSMQWSEQHDAGWKLFPGLSARLQWSLSAEKIFELLTTRPIDWLATDGSDETEPDGRSARRIVEKLKQGSDKPLFIGFGLHLPHVPFVAPKKYFDLYPINTVEIPREPKDHLKKVPEIAIPAQFQGEMNETQTRFAIRAYYASISYMDAQIGLVLDELKRQKMEDNTVIVFFSDHGFNLGEHGIWQKMSLFEDCTRVPLIIKAPGVKGGKVCKRPVELVDLYPTLVELCSLPVPDGLEGKSLKPLLDNPKATWQLQARSEVGRPNVPISDVWDWVWALNSVQTDGRIGRSLRTQRYRYTLWDEGRAGVELYDLNRDPKEWNNLAAAGRASRLHSEMHSLMQQTWPEK